jgi:hypothetical protein
MWEIRIENLLTTRKKMCIIFVRAIPSRPANPPPSRSFYREKNGIFPSIPFNQQSNM